MIIILALALPVFLFLADNGSETVSRVEYGPEAVIQNYGDGIKRYAQQFGFPPEYLAALCMLESGGTAEINARYEKHIYYRLLMLQKGIIGQYEHVKQEDLKKAGNEALRNLASSWGPFQIMGYKCLLLNIKVKDLRGENSVYWGTKWIDTTYGKFLKAGNYKSAFHMHNAGSPFPKNGKPRTYDPEYVNRGLKWMAYFKNRF